MGRRAAHAGADYHGTERGRGWGGEREDGGDGEP